MRRPKAPAPYYGGKQYHSNWINSLIAQDVACYAEPFGGMMSVMLYRKRPPKNGCTEVYNDIDERMTNMFRHLQEKETFDELVHAASWAMHSRSEHHRHVETFRRGTLGKEGALAALVGYSQGFGGIVSPSWKTSKALYGPGRVKGSKGMMRSQAMFLDNLELVRRRIAFVAFECLDWESFIDLYDGDDTLFYCDPPYVLDTRLDECENVYASEMTEEDHIRLLDVVLNVDGAVALSGYDSDLYRDFLADWNVQHKVTNARVNSRKHLTRRVEMLWRSPKCMAQWERER